MVLRRSGLLKRDKSGFDECYFGSLNIRKKGNKENPTHFTVEKGGPIFKNAVR